jgi:chromosomal replication initiation ATPase DnaA
MRKWTKTDIRNDMDAQQLYEAACRRGMREALRQAVEPCFVLPIEIFGRGRTPSVVRARGRFVLWLREHEFSLVEIGRIIGRDHTTVMLAIRRTRTRLAGAAQ